MMHFAAFLDVGESVREPASYYRNNVIGALSVLEAMAAESVEAVRLLVDLRHLRRADRDADRRNASAAADQQLRRDEAGGRARAAAFRARVRACAAVALRYFNAAGRRSRRRDRRGSLAGDPLIPRAIEAATGGRGLQVFGDDYPTPDGTCLRDYIHVTDLADAHVRALEAMVGDRTVGRLQPRHRPSAFGARGDRHGRARHRPHGAVDAGAAPRPAIRRCCMPAPQQGQTSCTGRRSWPPETIAHRVGLASHASARIRPAAAARAHRGQLRRCRVATATRTIRVPTLRRLFGYTRPYRGGSAGRWSGWSSTPSARPASRA